MNKPKFYVFLDIDGVLWDAGFLLKSLKHQVPLTNTQITNFKPSSMKALNTLLYFLEKKFDVELVISSAWRKKMAHATKVLYKNGLRYDKPLNNTGFSKSGYRGEEILDYLKGKPDSENLVIIDDFTKDIFAFFPYENIIKTSLLKALTKKQIADFLVYKIYNKPRKQNKTNLIEKETPVF